MNYHIVRVNEKLDQIASTYNLTINEIKSINQHIRDWDHLIAGTRINLPPIPDILNDELNDVEPFIEEYYPKIMNDFNDVDSIKNQNEQENKVVDINQNEKNNEENVVNTTTSNSKPKTPNYSHYPKSSAFYNGYYPLYPPYYPYYSPYVRKKRNSTKSKNI